MYDSERLVLQESIETLTRISNFPFLNSSTFFVNKRGEKKKKERKMRIFAIFASLIFTEQQQTADQQTQQQQQYCRSCKALWNVIIRRVEVLVTPIVNDLSLLHVIFTFDQVLAIGGRGEAEIHGSHLERRKSGIAILLHIISDRMTPFSY
jgi:hypothetical protein